MSSTACKLNVERLMILSTSAVAVCCWSDSRSSLSRPDVLDGYHGLARETLHQFDLVVGERPNLLAVNRDSANQIVLLKHRND